MKKSLFTLKFFAFSALTKIAAAVAVLPMGGLEVPKMDHFESAWTEDYFEAYIPQNEEVEKIALEKELYEEEEEEIPQYTVEEEEEAETGNTARFKKMVAAALFITFSPLLVTVLNSRKNNKNTLEEGGTKNSGGGAKESGASSVPELGGGEQEAATAGVYVPFVGTEETPSAEGIYIEPAVEQIPVITPVSPKKQEPEEAVNDGDKGSEEKKETVIDGGKKEDPLAGKKEPLEEGGKKEEINPLVGKEDKTDPVKEPKPKDTEASSKKNITIKDGGKKASKTQKSLNIEDGKNNTKGVADAEVGNPTEEEEEEPLEEDDTDGKTTVINGVTLGGDTPQDSSSSPDETGGYGEDITPQGDGGGMETPGSAAPAFASAIDYVAPDGGKPSVMVQKPTKSAKRKRKSRKEKKKKRKTNTDGSPKKEVSRAPEQDPKEDNIKDVKQEPLMSESRASYSAPYSSVSPAVEYAAPTANKPSMMVNNPSVMAQMASFTQPFTTNGIYPNNAAPINNSLSMRENKPSMMAKPKKKKDIFALVKAGNIKETEEILDEGYDVKGEKGDKLLHLAVKQGSAKICGLLLERGAKPNAKNKNKETLLHFSVKNNQEGIVRLLVSEGADPAQKDADGKTPIHYAAHQGKEALLALLLGRAEPNTKDSKGKNALHYAAEKGSYSCVECLIKNGAYIDEADDLKETALHKAAERGSTKIVELLLEKAKIDPKTGDGQTPLHKAVKNNKLSTVKILLERGADPFLKLRDKNIWELSTEVEVKKLLQKHMLFVALMEDMRTEIEILLTSEIFKPNIQDKDGNTPLHYAAEQGKENTINFLISKGADPTAKNDKGETPLVLSKTEKIEKIIKEAIKEKKYADFWLAIDQGDLKQVKTIFWEGFDLELPNKEGITLLQKTAKEGKKDIVDFLIEKGANKNVQDSKGKTALHYASVKGRLETVKLLIEKGADPTIKDNNEKTALDLAANEEVRTFLEEVRRVRNSGEIFEVVREGDLEKIKELIKKGADPNAKNKHGWTPLHNTVTLPKDKEEAEEELIHTKEKIKAIVEFLISAGADPNAKNKHGWTPLHLVASDGFYEMIELFLENGADPNIQDKEGRTLMHWASMHGYLDIVKKIVQQGSKIEYGCSINTHWDYREPLHYAALHGQLETVKFLIDKGANMYCTDNSRAMNTPLHLASDKKIIKIFVNKGCSVNKTNEFGQTILHNVVSCWCDGQDEKVKECVEWLLSAGADPTIKDRWEKVPLDYAKHYSVKEILSQEAKKYSPYFLFSGVYDGDKEKIRSVLEKGVDVNFQNEYGETPLRYAVELGKKEMVEFLLDKKAKTDIEDKQGRTPLFEAVKNGYKEIADLLIIKGKKINKKDKHGYTPLHLAVEKNDKEMVAFLLERNANIDEKDNRGYTPLHWAALRNKKEMVEILLKGGAKKTIKTKEGKIPADFASEKAVAKLLVYNNYIFKAVEKGDIEKVKQLLFQGINVNRQNKEGETLLYIAAKLSKKEMVEFLLSRGADPLLRTKKGEAPINASHTPTLKNIIAAEAFYSAVASGNVFGVEEILCSDISADIKLRYGWTPLQFACCRGKKEIVELLLTYGAHPNIQDEEGNTSLHLAAQEGHKNIIKRLLEDKDIDPNIQDKEGRTALHLAAKEKKIDVVKILLENEEVEEDIKDKEGRTALHLAGSYGVAKKLLEKGAKPNIQDKEGNTLLHEMVKKGDTKIVKLLLEYKADPDIKNREGEAPLFLALEKGIEKKDKTMFYLLYKERQTPSRTMGLRDKRDKTLLHYAAEIGDEDMVDMLLSRCESPNPIEKEEGNTPLHLAVCYGHYDCCISLLLKGADISIENKYGQTPIKMPHGCYNSRLVKFMDQVYRARTVIHDDGYPLHEHVSENNHDEIKILLTESNLDINKKDKDGYTPLYWAFMNDYKGKEFRVTELLLDNGANPYTPIPNSKGMFREQSSVYEHIIYSNMWQGDKERLRKKCQANYKS